MQETWETQVRSLGREQPLEEEMAPHSNIPAGESLGQRRLVGSSPWGHKESDTTDWAYSQTLGEERRRGEMKVERRAGVGERMKEGTTRREHRGKMFQETTPLVIFTHWEIRLCVVNHISVKLGGHPRRNSRIYPTCLPQLEKTHETSPSPRDEAQFPCIECSAIPCPQYNTKGALICLMEIQSVPKNNITCLEWHWCHQRNVKLFGVTQINSRWRPTLLYWI